jgi:hypothetical protein
MDAGRKIRNAPKEHSVSKKRYRNRLPPTRVSCQAHFTRELTARIEEFLYQFFVQWFLRAERNPQGVTVETLQAALLEMDERNSMKLFHEICDPELLCPRCGGIHGTVENFRKNVGRILNGITGHMDHQKLCEAMQQEREKAR